MTDTTDTQQSSDDDQITELNAALRTLQDGRRTAISTVEYWRGMAEMLTEYRRHRTNFRPALPLGHEEWMFTSVPDLPFMDEELEAELLGLSSVITKAHTISRIYTDRAATLQRDADMITTYLNTLNK